MNPQHSRPEAAPAEFASVEALLRFVADDPAPALPARRFSSNNANGRLALLALAGLGPRRADGSPLDLPAELSKGGSGAVGELVKGHRSNPAARAFWLERTPVTGNEPLVVLESHLVSPPAAAALRSGHVHEFLATRRADFAKLCDTFLAIRLERGSAIRPPLDQLFVPDPPDGLADDE